MVVRTIKFPDYHGNERVMDFYFNYSEAELAKMEWSKNGGFSTYFKRIIDSQNIVEIAEVFDKIILESYCEPSDDGLYLRKGKDHELARKFMETEAYNLFFMELMTKKGELAKFFNELIPKRLAEKANALIAEEEAKEKDRVDNAISDWDFTTGSDSTSDSTES